MKNSKTDSDQKSKRKKATKSSASNGTIRKVQGTRKQAKVVKDA